MKAPALSVQAQQTERFAARRVAEAQRELKHALDAGDAARSIAATLQLSSARKDLQRAIRSLALITQRERS